MTRLLRPRTCGLLLATAAAVVAPAVAAAPANAAPKTGDDAAIRAAHFSPTTPGVDVYLGRFAGGRAPSKLWLSKITYGGVTGYQPLTPGLYTVAMRTAGAPATSRPMLTWTLNARPHAAYTVAGVGAGSAVRGVVVKDELTSPPKGEGRVRVVQAASRAPVATLTATGGKTIAGDVRFASVTGYTTLPTGRWTVRAQGAGGVTTSAPVTVTPGRLTSLLLLDGKPGGITLRTVFDSSAPATTPRSSVDAGMGGTATDVVGGEGSSLVPPLAVGAGAIAFVALFALRRRVAR